MAHSSESHGPPPLRVLSPAVAGLFSLAAFASVALVPLFGVFLGLLASLPLLHLVAVGRPSILGWGWVSITLVGAALLWQQPWLVALALGYVLVAAWPAVSVEAWLRRPWQTGRWAAWVTLVALGALSVALIAAYHPQHPAEGLRASLAAAAAGGEELARLLGGSSESKDLLAAAIELAAYLAPAILASYVLSAALWVRPRLAALGLPRGSEPFALYSSEEWLPVGFALGGLGWVFAGGVTKWLASNLFATVLGLYFIHGLAIIHFYLGRRFGTNRWVRVAVALFALQIPVAVALAVLGLADSFFRLRRGAVSDEGSEA